jgi:hypothetical protein
VVRVVEKARPGWAVSSKSRRWRTHTRWEARRRTLHTSALLWRRLRTRLLENVGHVDKARRVAHVRVETGRHAVARTGWWRRTSHIREVGREVLRSSRTSVRHLLSSALAAWLEGTIGVAALSLLQDNRRVLDEARRSTRTALVHVLIATEQLLLD